ncbi:MAG: hypothetical protein H6974_05385 [Gammaproteobacteria bacterium]|nr:hypothetical protein [Gammaproteobacteria bacterium]
MNPPGLSFEQAPPFGVPLRFFLTAPWFLVLAAALLFWQGPDIFASRWLPATLALTHLLVLGFMAQVMLGALLQILPVVVGVTVPYPNLTATLVHLPLTLGTLVLAGAFLGIGPVGFQIAFGLLGLGLGVALTAFQLAIWRAPMVSDTVIALRCALAALLITVTLGLLLGSYFGWGGLRLPVALLTNLHAVWGVIGWTVLLVASVAYQVVPMFQMTPLYPQWLSRGFAPLIATLLVAGSASTAMGWTVAVSWIGVGLAVGLSLFAVGTLMLLGRRQRKIGDPTLSYWRVSMVSLLVGAVLALLMRFVPAWATAPRMELLMGVALIFGFAVMVINGMLYKIVPFLAWFHLQAQLLGRGRPPNMKMLLPEARICRQFWASLSALWLLLAAIFYPFPFTYPAALALGMSSAWLGINLLSVWRIYRRALQQHC